MQRVVFWPMQARCKGFQFPARPPTAIAARPAVALAAIGGRVDGIVRMALRAVRLASIVARAAVEIRPMRDGFKVRGIHAARIPACMIEHSARGDRPAGQLIGDLMRGAHPAPHADLAVALATAREPGPACHRIAAIDFLPETIRIHVFVAASRKVSTCCVRSTRLAAKRARSASTFPKL